MSLIIEAQQTAQRLFGALTEQILAARKRAEERQRKTPDPGKPARAGAAPPADGRPRVQRPRAGAGGVRGYQPPRPAAQRGGYPVGTGWFRAVRPGYEGTLQVWSGDLSSMVTVDYGHPDPADPGWAVNAFYLSGDSDEIVYAMSGIENLSVFSGARLELSFVLSISKDRFIYARVIRESYAYDIQGVEILWPDSSVAQPDPTVVDGPAASGNYNAVLCFYVDRTTVRQIDAPAGLQSRIEAAYPGFSFAASSGSGTVPANLIVVPIDTPFGPRAATASTNPSGTLTRSVLGMSSDLPSETYPPRDRISKWTAYGFLSTAEAQGTPGVYSFLTNYADEYNGNPAPFDENAIREAHLGGLPLPRILVFPGANATTDETTGELTSFEVLNDYIRASFYPEGGVTLEELLRNRPGQLQIAPEALPLISGEEGAFQLRSWDWGAPGYCQAQLLALGFTGADLAP